MNDEIKDNREAIVFDPTSVKKAKSWEDFISLWTISKELEIKNQWFRGDIACRLEVTYGKSGLKKFAREVGESIGSIEHYRRVARAFPVGKRNWNLTWTHYLLASLTDSFKKRDNKFFGGDRFQWIEKAHDRGWSTTRLQEEIKKKKAFKQDGKDVFSYYEEYLGKVRGVLMHVEKNRLQEVEKNKLIHKLLDIYNEFMVYLKSA